MEKEKKKEKRRRGEGRKGGKERRAAAGQAAAGQAAAGQAAAVHRRIGTGGPGRGCRGGVTSDAISINMQPFWLQ